MYDNDSIFLIMTYWKDLPKANKVKINLIQLGIEEESIFIVEGYDHKKINKDVRIAIYKGFMEKVIPLVLEKKKNFYYVESNSIIYENPRYFPKYEPIHWLGFLKKMKHFIVGAHLVYFDYNSFMEKIYLNIEKSIPQHIDGLIRKWGLKYGMEIDKSITQIMPHYSYNIGKIRVSKMNHHFYLPENA